MFRIMFFLLISISNNAFAQESYNAGEFLGGSSRTNLPQRQSGDSTVSLNDHEVELFIKVLSNSEKGENMQKLFGVVIKNIDYDFSKSYNQQKIFTEAMCENVSVAELLAYKVPYTDIILAMKRIADGPKDVSCLFNVVPGLQNYVNSKSQDRPVNQGQVNYLQNLFNTDDGLNLTINIPSSSSSPSSFPIHSRRGSFDNYPSNNTGLTININAQSGANVNINISPILSPRDNVNGRITNFDVRSNAQPEPTNAQPEPTSAQLDPMDIDDSMDVSTQSRNNGRITNIDANPRVQADPMQIANLVGVSTQIDLLVLHSNNPRTILETGTELNLYEKIFSRESFYQAKREALIDLFTQVLSQMKKDEYTCDITNMTFFEKIIMTYKPNPFISTSYYGNHHDATVLSKGIVNAMQSIAFDPKKAAIFEAKVSGLTAFAKRQKNKRTVSINNLTRP